MKKMNRVLAGVAAAALLSAPVAAADLGYNMGLKQEAKTYGGLYYAIPFQGGTKRDTREGAKLGMQVDRSGRTSLDPFAGGTGLQEKAMFDISFDSQLNLNGFYVNGMDTVSLYDRLNAEGGEGGIIGANGALIAVAVVVGAAVLVNNQDNDDAPNCEEDEDDDPKFTDARYMESTDECDDDIEE